MGNVQLVTAPGQWLRADAAASWDALATEVRRRHGWTPVLTDSTRPYATQVEIFRERYVPRYTQYAPGKVDRRVWNGVAYYRLPGTAAAAVPGTSRHGFGIAVDASALGGFHGTRYAQLAALAPAYGWDNEVGKTIAEAWHWEYTPANDTHPKPPTQMETDMPYIVRCRVAGHAHQGTWWIVLPRAGQAPLASPLGKADTTEGIPAINYVTADGYDRWRSTVAGA